MSGSDYIAYVPVFWSPLNGVKEKKELQRQTNIFVL